MNGIKIKALKRVNRNIVSEIISLYKQAGWFEENDDYARISKLIRKSFLFVVAQKNRKIIGMAKVISDGVSEAYIQDFVIDKKYRRMGIGSMILSFTVRYLLNKGIRLIYVVSENNTESFYIKNNFKLMSSRKFLIYETKKVD